MAGDGSGRGRSAKDSDAVWFVGLGGETLTWDRAISKLNLVGWGRLTRLEIMRTQPCLTGIWSESARNNILETLQFTSSHSVSLCTNRACWSQKENPRCVKYKPRNCGVFRLYIPIHQNLSIAENSSLEYVHPVSRDPVTNDGSLTMNTELSGPGFWQWRDFWSTIAMWAIAKTSINLWVSKLYID